MNDLRLTRHVNEQAVLSVNRVSNAGPVHIDALNVLTKGRSEGSLYGCSSSYFAELLYMSVIELSSCDEALLLRLFCKVCICYQCYIQVTFKPITGPPLTKPINWLKFARELNDL